MNNQHTDTLAVVFLGIALIMAIHYRMTELAAAIGGGLVGYIRGAASRKGE